MTLDEIKKTAIPACKEYDVKRLDIFGSHATRREKSELSDIDFIVEFNEPAYKPSKQYFGLLHYFKDTFKCAIDLVTLDGVKNPYFRHRVIIITPLENRRENDGMFPSFQRRRYAGKNP